MRKNKNKPYFVGNVLHYWHDGKLKTFDCSNENVNNQAEKSDKHNGIGRTENGTFYQERLPDEVVKALLETGEYLWTKGDRFNDYFADVYHKCWIPLGTTERMGNVASNPCYGMVRRENDKMELCPRCAAIYGIWNNKKCKPLKYKVWDFLLDVKSFFRWRVIHNLYKDCETFYFAHNKEGHAVLKGWQKAIEEGVVGELTYWRRHYLKPILKGSNLVYLDGEKDEWFIYNPELYDEDTVKEMIENNRYNVIWEHEDYVKVRNGIKILTDKEWERG